MIQRIQTIWLLIAGALGFVSLKTSVCSGHLISDAAKTFVTVTGMYNLQLTVCTILIVLGCVITIFLFKNRKRQIAISICILLISLLMLFCYYKALQSFIPAESSYDLTIIIPILIPIFLFLAIRGIWKDERLIKKADKLR